MPKVELSHPNAFVAQTLLKEALGTDSGDFSSGIILQLTNAGSKGEEIDEETLNFLLSMVTGIKPNDQLEAMLAAQMAIIHAATMQFGARLSRVQTLQQQDSAERALNKLARTFAMQMEALKRYRTGASKRSRCSTYQ